MQSLQIGAHKFEWGSRTYVLGILNITHDSFSGDGLFPPLPVGVPGGDDKNKGEGELRSLEQAREFRTNGADILDVGGESTRPGSKPVGVDEELERVLA